MNQIETHQTRAILVGIWLTLLLAVSAQAAAPDKIAALLEKATAGDALSQYALSTRYAIGAGVPLDESLAEYWMVKAANQDYEPALRAITHDYDGIGYNTGDFSRAVYWAARASKRGLPIGFEYLGGYYAKGQGVPVDKAKAWELLQQAAALNFPQRPDLQRACAALYRSWLDGGKYRGCIDLDPEFRRVMDPATFGGKPSSGASIDATDVVIAAGAILVLSEILSSGSRSTKAATATEESLRYYPELAQCRAEAQRYIVECAKITDHDSCTMTGCDTRVICDRRRGGCENHDAPYGRYGIFYCDTRDWRRRDADHAAVLALACPAGK